MEYSKIIMIASAIVLPVLVTFGWKVLKKTILFIRKHHLVSFKGDDCEFAYDDTVYLNDDVYNNKDRMIYKDYTDECYC